MIIRYSRDRLCSNIFLFIGGLLFVGLAVNGWNVTHMVGEYDYGGCNKFIDIFGVHKEQCFVGSPDFPFITNIVFVIGWVGILLSELNSRKRFLVFKNTDEYSRNA